MIKKDNFGEICSKDFEVGDMVEWTTWNKENNIWCSNYGIIIKIENQIKSNRLVSISTVKPINEVYSEKQRRWACAQIDDPDELTKKQAKEMCTGPMKKEISSMGSGAVAGTSGKKEKETLIREEENLKKSMLLLIKFVLFCLSHNGM